MIEVAALHKNYAATRALVDASVTFETGTVTALVGPNAAGKSTLLNLICGRIQPSSGRITVDGTIGYAPQRDTVWHELTVREHLRLFRKLQNATDTDIQRVVDGLVLANVIDQRGATLSGGYRKRLSIAIALLNDPQNLILDEPETGLDVASRQIIRRLAVDSARRGKTVLVATHEIDTLRHFVDQIAFLHKGRIVQVNSIDAIDDINTTFTKLTG